ncbi:MAG: hypothetical protein NC827_04465 [Candidatus Omnitrophica bacterium]|nr:hypothetical protein [Candidatus Omnitrophota bacterium]MCM8802545.1 hypothetical protein [Candidatus Omnitrophota bacterium]
MKNLLLIYEVDEEYIKRVLSFFKFFCLKEVLPLNFYAKKWLKGRILDETLFVDDNFNIQTTKIKNLDCFHFSFILSLNQEFEHQNHKRISEYLKKYKINQLNPFSASFFSSNKYRTIEKLRKFNIYTPSSIFIEFKDRKRLKENVEKFIINQKTDGFYIQPNYGTEGKQTYFFTKKEIIENFDFLIETIMSILPEQPVIIKEKRGNIYYYKEEEKIRGYREIVLRFFIFEYGKKVFSNWCFFEISDNEKIPITSSYKGGKILNFEDVKNNLYYRTGEDFKKFVMLETHKTQIISEITKIFKFFNMGLKGKLKIGGIDILLEVDGKDLKIIFLELNPRPSGIDKLDLFAKISPSM